VLRFEWQSVGRPAQQADERGRIQRIRELQVVARFADSLDPIAPRRFAAAADCHAQPSVPLCGYLIFVIFVIFVAFVLIAP
jgi:hypothetical protein